jgi:hypothetical protein
MVGLVANVSKRRQVDHHRNVSPPENEKTQVHFVPTLRVLLHRVMARPQATYEEVRRYGGAEVRR